MSDCYSRRRWLQATGLAGTTAVMTVAVPGTTVAQQPANNTAKVTRRVKVEKVDVGTSHWETKSNVSSLISQDELVFSVLFDSLVATAAGRASATNQTKPAEKKKVVDQKERLSKRAQSSCAAAHLLVDWTNNIDNTMVGFTVDVRGGGILVGEAQGIVMVTFGGTTQTTVVTEKSLKADNGEYFVRFFVPAAEVKTLTTLTWQLTAVAVAQGGRDPQQTALIAIDSIDIEAAFKSYPPNPLPAGNNTTRT